MAQLAIIAALPRELSLLSRRLRATTVSKSNGVLLQTAARGSQSSILLLSAGMGPQRVALAVAAALAHGPVDALLSVGLAGACDPALLPGSVLAATLVVDVRSGERYTPAVNFNLPSRGVLVTAPEIAGAHEKERLHRSYSALAVDMEAATVARLARAHGIRFGALKAISDEHSVDLTHLSRFTGPRGHFRAAPFALHTALRPHLWQPTLRLGRNSGVALEALTRALQQHLAELPGSA